MLCLSPDRSKQASEGTSALPPFPNQQLSCYLIGYPGSYPADPSMLGFDAITLAIRAAIVLSLWLSG